MTKTQDAQQAGAYKATSIDAAKAAADFRLIDISCGNRIVWSDGRRECVNNRQLSKLQATHTWACDF